MRNIKTTAYYKPLEKGFYENKWVSEETLRDLRIIQNYELFYVSEEEYKDSLVK